LPALAPRLKSWARPEATLAEVRDRLLAALGELGIALAAPALHFADGLPPPYDPPALAAVSIDPSDARPFGLAPGIHFARRRLAPLVSESVLGHVLVHAALGERSPSLLGRGLEEGLAEVVGGVWAAGRVVGNDAVDGGFAARLTTGALTRHRE